MINMAKMESLDKKFKVENGSVVITEVVQKTANRHELEAEKMGYSNQIAGIEQQIKGLKERKQAMIQGIAEIDEMLAAMPIEVDED
jgi:Skp family chaperone for outer membrane proteins